MSLSHVAIALVTLLYTCICCPVVSHCLAGWLVTIKPQENLAFEDSAVHAESGCSVDADDEPDADNVHMACPQRNRRPPDRYGIYVEHYDLAQMQETRRRVL